MLTGHQNNVRFQICMNVHVHCQITCRGFVLFFNQCRHIQEDKNVEYIWWKMKAQESSKRFTKILVLFHLIPSISRLTKTRYWQTSWNNHGRARGDLFCSWQPNCCFLCQEMWTLPSIAFQNESMKKQNSFEIQIQTKSVLYLSVWVPLLPSEGIDEARQLDSWNRYFLSP